jgi:protein SCO1
MRCLRLGLACLAALAPVFGPGLAYGQAHVRDLSLEKDPTQFVGLDQRLGAALRPELTLRDEGGREVRLLEVADGKPFVLALVYYSCPRLCTEVLNGTVSCLRELSLRMGTDYHFVAVSIDPSETPELAARKRSAYLESLGERGSEAGWHFLTARSEVIAEIASTVGYRYVFDERAQQYAHASGLIVVTQEGRLSHYFYGVRYSAKDLRLALVEASAGEIGNAVDQLLLLCFHYDPTTGRYGFAIFALIRALGVATVVALACCIFVFLRRERRASPAGS